MLMSAECVDRKLSVNMLVSTKKCHVLTRYQCWTEPCPGHFTSLFEFCPQLRVVTSTQSQPSGDLKVISGDFNHMTLANTLASHSL